MQLQKVLNVIPFTFPNCFRIFFLPSRPNATAFGFVSQALLERKQQRKKETLEIVVAEVKREEEGEDLDDAEALPPDDDDMDEEEEMDQWKLRELRRIKRDKEQEEEYEKTLSDVERRRMMTDEEVIAENKNNPKKHKPKGEMRFMQKYYHPGAFFADTVCFCVSA